MTLKTVLDINAGHALLQRHFTGNCKLTQNTFNFYKTQRYRAYIKTIIIIKKHLQDEIIMEHKSNLVNQFQFVFFEIQNLDQQIKQTKQIMQIFNIYDN